MASFVESAISWRPSSKTLRFDMPWQAAAGDETPETLRCLWPFFRFSRLIGMCPLTRHGNKFQLAKKWHPSWISTWFSLCLLFLMWTNFMVKAFPIKKGTNALVSTSNTIIYYTQILFNCIYMIRKTKDIPHFVTSCITVEVICRKEQKGPKTTTGLIRNTYLLFVFYTTAQFFGNALYYASVAKTYNLRTAWEFFHAYNEEFVLVKGNAFSGVLFLFTQFYCDMGWSFPDILQATLSLMLGRLFTRLNRVMASEKDISLKRVEQLRADHRQICELICNDIFAPLFFMTYVANVAYLFTRLYTGLGDDLKHGHILVQLEALYAFVFLIFIKILWPSYLAAKLNQNAHEGLDLIHNWGSTVEAPDYKYKLLVISRFVSQTSTDDIGLSGCGYFTITKSFLVTLISALITYEVIVLQFQAAALKASE